MKNKQLVCAGMGLEGEIKALLKFIQQKRKPNRMNTQADVILLALQEYKERMK